MIEIMGVKFLNDKEASDRYGYSRSWFQQAREKGGGPPFIKMGPGCARVLYNLENTDNWFKERMKSKE